VSFLDRVSARKWRGQSTPADKNENDVIVVENFSRGGDNVKKGGGNLGNERGGLVDF
jgi:hypothetical protein